MVIGFDQPAVEIDANPEVSDNRLANCLTAPERLSEGNGRQSRVAGT